MAGRRHASLLLLATLAASSASAASGPADSGGYTWLDDADGCEATGLAFGPGAFSVPGTTAVLGPISLGFTGTYYGAPVTDVWVNPNGYLTFSNQGPVSITPQTMPNNLAPNHVVAAYWSGNATGDVTYEASPGVFHVKWAQVYGIGRQSEAHLFIYADGHMRMAWTVLPAFSVGAIVGYEDDMGVRGRTFYRGSDVEPGFVMATGRFLCIFPPANLDCTNPVFARCGDSLPLTLPAAVTTPASAYSCSSNSYPGNEQVVSVGVSEASAVTISVSNPALDIIAVREPPRCSEFDCTAQVDDVLSYSVMYPGQYWFVIDKDTPGGGDAYTLSVTCDPIATALACGSPVSADTTGGRLILNDHSCRAGDYSGAEVYYRVAHPGGSLLATLTAAPALDVFILDANDATNCIAAGDASAAAFGLAPGDYLLAVDGPRGSEGPFTLEVACGTQIQCMPLEPQVLTCAGSVAGNTAGGRTDVRRYACNAGDFPGPERVYELQIPPGQTDVIVELQTTDDLGMFVLSSCDEGACVAGGRRFACLPNPAPGSYFLVVDSGTAAGGNYTLQVTCDAVIGFDRWIACTNPRTMGAAPGCGIPNAEPTTAATTAAHMWSFSDGAFCVSNMMHKAYPYFQRGEDCKFAMYVVAECGTSMNIPLCDNETGDIAIWDVIGGRYVDLFATSDSAGCAGGPWSQTGQRIQWQDCAGMNCFWNNKITSVSFQGSPTLCGVYRVEFTNWGGNVWDLFANCSGRNEPGFMIYDNLCEAMNAFSPKPELSIVNPVLNGTCPNYTLDFEVHNTGCTAGSGFCVRYWEESLTGDIEHTDPALTCDLSVAAGTAQRFSVPVDLTAITSQALRLEVDPDDVVLECSEAPSGSVVACGAAAGARLFRVPVCGSCVSVPAGTRQPAKACFGDPARFEDAGSQVVPCVQGIEYAWTSAPMAPPSGTTCTMPDELECWGDMNSVLNVPALAPPVGERFVTLYLWTRCVEDPSCVNATPYPLVVEVHRPPTLGLGTSLDLDPCHSAIVVSWEPATFYHDAALGPGTYNLYRVDSTGDIAADCMRVRDPANLIVSDLTAASYLDQTTVPNGQYVYLVEAEDREPMNPCLPRGPVRQGATAIACIAELVGAPAVDEFDVLAPYPGVGNTLRATSGDEAGVAFSWADVLTQPGREFFRVIRSTYPQVGFTDVSGPLGTAAFDDRAAPDALYYYKIQTYDSCGNTAAYSFPNLPPRPLTCKNLNLRCGDSVDSDTRACTNAWGAHACDAADSSGRDRTHEAWTDRDGDVTFTLDAPATNLHLVVYDTTMNTCLGASATSVTVPAARANTRYIVVVDEPAGQEAGYRITMSCP